MARPKTLYHSLSVRLSNKNKKQLEILEIYTGKNKTQLASEMINNMFEDKQLEIVDVLSGIERY